MQYIGQIIIYITMFCALVGALASVFRPHSSLGNQFILGVETIGTIFLPIAGIMAMSPIITAFIINIVSPIYQCVGADPAMASTTFIAVDMGGYQLAHSLALTNESWIMAMITGYMSGATIVFTIPIALKLLNKEDHPYLAFGTMAGFIAIPIGVLVSSLIIFFTQPTIRNIVSTTSSNQYQLHLSLLSMLQNLLPLVVICILIVLGLSYKPKMMLKGFQNFGTILNSLLKLIFVLCVIDHFVDLQYFFYNYLHIPWPLDPIVADSENINRALESAGYISMMLCGAFPMVYLIKKYIIKLFNKSRKMYINLELFEALIACSANVVALFSLITEMKPENKIKTLAYAVCCAFLLGDHLAFTANFQPSLILIVMLGKLSAGITAILISHYFIIPRFINRVE